MLRLLSISGLLLFAFQSDAQLTYQLGGTTLLIDEVVDSSRVDMPWEIIWGPDERLWMTDGPRIIRWDPLTDVIDTLLDRGHGNGLGMALHPDFPDTPIVMAVFDTSGYYGGGVLCEVSRFTYDAMDDAIVDEQLLFTYRHAGEHAGGRLLFDTTGHVLLTTADYNLLNPDTLFSPIGKTLRFATDGSVPPDNPRADRTWTWGHRNPQGLAMLPNGAIVNSEHGQMFEGNEINLLQRDEDHGYPYYDGTACFFVPDTCTSPTYSYTHPLWTFSHPPAGCEFYTSDLIPELQGKLITCILWHRGLMLFEFSPALDSVVGEEYLFGGPFDAMWRNRDIAIRPDGSFYLITNDRGDARIRWVHTDPGTTVGQVSIGTGVIRAWPNPAAEKLILEVPGGAKTIDVLDASGRSFPIEPVRVGDRYVLDARMLPAGAYIARTSDGRATRFVKL